MGQRPGVRTDNSGETKAFYTALGDKAWNLRQHLDTRRNVPVTKKTFPAGVIART